MAHLHEITAGKQMTDEERAAFAIALSNNSHHDEGHCVYPNFKVEDSIRLVIYRRAVKAGHYNEWPLEPRLGRA